MDKLITIKVLSGTFGSQSGARFVDDGRPGLRHLAIPTGGAVDRYAHQVANQLLGNPADSPTLEIPLKGGSYQFSAACRIVLTGANFAWALDGQPVPQYQTVEVRAKQILQGSFSKNGAYGYLTVAGKWEIPCTLGSHETVPWAESTMDRDSRNAKIHKLENQKNASPSFINEPTLPVEFPAQARDNKLWKFWMSKINNRITMTPSTVTCPLYTERNETLELVVFPGPEFGLLSPSAQEELFASSWQLTSVRSRQGIRLLGNSIALKDAFAASSMISSPVLPGTVQLTPSGPIILGPDAQTVGGYPRIAVLSPRDIGKCFQASTGGYLKFIFV